MLVENVTSSDNWFQETDLYIFTAGYESRSVYLYSKFASNLTKSNTLVFVLNDCQQFNHISEVVSDLEKKNILINRVNYSDSTQAHKTINEFVIKYLMQHPSIPIRVHIDYSSMPRAWYCKLPFIFETVLRKTDQALFWYSEGEYPSSYQEYPSAGIESISLFSGKPSLRIDSNRAHVIALGYDAIRTQAIISIIDPDYLVACYAHNPQKMNVQEGILKVNYHQLSQAAMTLSLHINDFSFMLSKLREMANDLLTSGDVIFVPDGPKPLILAMSMIPSLINKQGITCLHVARNMECFRPVDVVPTGALFGFSIARNH